MKQASALIPERETLFLLHVKAVQGGQKVKTTLWKSRMLYFCHSHGRAEPNVAEKETQIADGDLRILLEAFQRHGIDQRLPDIQDTPSDTRSSNLTLRTKKEDSKSARNHSGRFFMRWIFGYRFCE